MKNKLLNLFLLSIVFIGVGCSNKNSSSSSENSEYSSINNSSEFASSSENSSEELIKLDTPILSLNSDTGVVSWNLVDGATHYNYVINDGEVLTTTNNSITLLDKQNISVQASNETVCSEFSKAITYYDTSDIISDEKQVNVYFHDTDLNSISVITGETISKPVTPTKDNHIFDDWYSDPFYQEKFDFSKPIEGKTIVYANFIPESYIRDSYFWVKASPKITSNIISSTTSSTGWRFIPLKVNENKSLYKEFYTTVQVTGATASDPAKFLVMDGFDDEPGRTYWKNNGSDFVIGKDGTYGIYFSLEYQYSQNIHVQVKQVTNAGLSYINRRNSVSTIKTPKVEINTSNNTAYWEKDNNATKYEVVIDNGSIKEVTENSIALSKGSHISVRTVYSNNYKSNWSIPKANINVIYQDNNDDPYAYVYFLNSEMNSIKVEKGGTVNNVELEGDSIRTFEGWYLEPSLINKVTFPYVVNENTTFYPKWKYVSEVYSKDYYYLVDSNGTVIDGLIWNYENYDFYEYEVKGISLNNGTYRVVSLDKKTTYETFTIGSNGKYSIYFSEDKLWTNQGSSRHVYVQEILETVNVYFTRNRDSWKTGTLYAYVWNENTNEKMSNWPGSSMTYSHTNSYGEDIYTIQIDLSKYDHLIFAVDTSSEIKQTPDISLNNITNNQGYYISGGKDSAGKYPVGTWTYNG